MAVRVLADQDMAARIVRLSPWLRLEISEHFLPADGQPERDPLLKGLRSLAPLWLDDFGSGTAGLSALMTTTVTSMKTTIEEIRKECPHVTVIVGGAVLTPALAIHVGADFYAKDAMESVRIAGKHQGTA